MRTVKIFRSLFATMLIAMLVSMHGAPLVTYADEVATSSESDAASTETSSSTEITSDTETVTDTSEASSTIDATSDASTSPNETVAPAEITTQTPTSESSSASGAATSTEQAVEINDPTGTSSSAAASSTQSESGSTSATTTTESTSIDEQSSESAATTTDDLSIHASGPGLIDPSASTSTASESTESATTTASGFQPVASTASTSSGNSATTSTTTSPEAAVASSTQTILSGDATALANILNILNTSFVNSNGAILFANLTDDAGDLDFRNSALFAGLCGDVACSALNGVQINLLNDGTILNNLYLIANSGLNTIGNASSSAGIGTGDAFAGLNLINLANNTFINSNYLILTLNAFRDVNGDLVFPALGAFLQALTGSLADGSTIDINNTTSVGNDVSADAESGDNTLSNVDGASAITTGSSDAYVNVFNQLGSLFMNNGISILLRIGGSWNGEVQGLVPGVSVIPTDQGIFIVGGGGGGGNPLLLGLDASSTAAIENRARLEALTGQNTIANASSSALISTGNAFAGANIVNLANQTVVGRNWLLAVINIFGDFTGNVVFGRPDLWVGAALDAPGDVRNGSELTYHITVKNNGDARATNVQLTEHFDAAHLTMGDASQDFTAGDGTITFALGDLQPHEERQVSFTATVKDTDAGDAITSMTNVRAHERDGNDADNTDSITIHTANNSSGSSRSSENDADDATADSRGAAALHVTRTTASLTATQGAAVQQVLEVHNESSTRASAVRLTDALRDPNGKVIHQEVFDIGDLLPGEAVRITYDLQFNEQAIAGRYTLSSTLSGTDAPATTAENGSIFLSLSPAQQRVPAVSFEPLTAQPVAAIATSSEALVPEIPDAGINTNALTAAAGGLDSSDALLFLVASLTLALLAWIGREVYRINTMPV